MKRNVTISLFVGIILGAVTVYAQFQLPALNAFPDVSRNDFFYNGVEWAKNIIAGYNDGRFGPNDAVTRGQFLLVLSKYDEKLLNNSDITVLFELFCTKFSENDFSDLNKRQMFTTLCTEADGGPNMYY